MCIPEAQTTVGAVISAVDSVLRQPLFYSVQAFFLFSFHTWCNGTFDFPKYICMHHLHRLTVF